LPDIDDNMIKAIDNMVEKEVEKKGRSKN